MPSKKRQHYVPRSLLKRFSVCEKQINLYLLASRRFIKQASLRDQCYRDYYYGKDAPIEDGFAAMEGHANVLLGDLTEATLDGLTDQQLWDLKMFVHYQYCM